MHSNFRLIFLLHLLILPSLSQSFSQKHKVVESSNEYIIVEFDFSNSYVIENTIVDGRKYNVIKGDENYYRNPGDPWLPLVNLSIGIPHDSNPTMQILRNDRISYSNKFIMPYPETDPLFEKPDVEKINKEIYSKSQFFPYEIVQINSPYDFRYAKILPIAVSPYQFNPVTRELVYNNKFVVKINFNARSETIRTALSDAMTEGYLKSAVINAENAKNWISKPIPTLDSPLIGNDSWYDPDKNYFKIYLKEKGVYRVNYIELISAGVPLGNNTPIEKLELFNNGNPVPIDLVDTNNDQLFNSNDYLQFIGYPAPPSPFVKMNLYNLSNVYWFSYESDSTGNIYNNVDGFPQSWSKTIQSTKHVVHFEKDSIFERMGYSTTEEIDYWFWGKANAQDGHAVFGFEDRFVGFENRTVDSNYVTLRVKMHGMTNNSRCNPEHKAYIKITDQLIGVQYWDGQEQQTFEKKFYISSDSINIFPVGNRLNVWVTGEACPAPSNNDEIRVNWYEFEYWRALKTNPDNFMFKSHEFGNIRFWTFGWLKNNMKIYIPERNKMISNPHITNDQYNSVFFVDTAQVGTEYFCVADNYFLAVDSIVNDQPSKLRHIANALII